MVLSTNKLNHDLGQHQCKDYNGFLPEPKSKAENDFLHQLTTGSKVPLGLNDKHREDHWVYDSDGTNVKYNQWKPNQPTNIKNENCVMMEESGDWDDVACNTNVTYKTSDKHENLICQKNERELISNYYSSLFC